MPSKQPLKKDMNLAPGQEYKKEVFKSWQQFAFKENLWINNACTFLRNFTKSNSWLWRSCKKLLLKIVFYGKVKFTCYSFLWKYVINFLLCIHCGLYRWALSHWPAMSLSYLLQNNSICRFSLWHYLSFHWDCHNLVHLVMAILCVCSHLQIVSQFIFICKIHKDTSYVFFFSFSFYYSSIILWCFIFT